MYISRTRAAKRGLLMTDIVTFKAFLVERETHAVSGRPTGFFTPTEFGTFDENALILWYFVLPKSKSCFFFLPGARIPSSRAALSGQIPHTHTLNSVYLLRDKAETTLKKIVGQSPDFSVSSTPSRKLSGRGNC